MKGTAAKSFVAAFDLEKAAHHGASSTGESLATGGILSVNLLKVGSAAASPSRAYINCLYDAVAELKDSGCFVSIEPIKGEISKERRSQSMFNLRRKDSGKCIVA